MVETRNSDKGKRDENGRLIPDNIESNMNKTDQTIRAITLHTQGEKQREIAKELGVSQSTVCRMLSDDKTKAIIDRIHNRYIPAGP